MPKVYLRAPGEVEPCESFKLDVGVVEGIGAWEFDYEWSVEGFGNNEQAVIDMLTKASTNKRKMVLKWNNAIVSRNKKI